MPKILSSPGFILNVKFVELYYPPNEVARHVMLLENLYEQLVGEDDHHMDLKIWS